MGIAIFTKTKPRVGTFIPDASVREEHALENEITDAPIEDGSVVTHHVLTLPRVVSLELAITNTPDNFAIASASSAIVAAALGAIVGATAGSGPGVGVAAAAGPAIAGAAAAALIPGLDNTRHLKGWAQLLSIGRRRVPFDVVTSLESYRNMMIQRVSTPRSKENTNALFITVVCRQIEIARVDEAANLADAAVDAALGEQDLGAIGTEVAGAA